MVVGEFTASSIANEQDRMEDDQREKLTTSKVDYAKLDADVAALKALAAKVRCLIWNCCEGGSGQQQADWLSCRGLATVHQPAVFCLSPL